MLPPKFWQSHITLLTVYSNSNMQKMDTFAQTTFLKENSSVVLWNEMSEQNSPLANRAVNNNSPEFSSQ